MLAGEFGTNSEFYKRKLNENILWSKASDRQGLDAEVSGPLHELLACISAVPHPGVRFPGTAEQRGCRGCDAALSTSTPAERPGLTGTWVCGESVCPGKCQQISSAHFTVVKCDDQRTANDRLESKEEGGPPKHATLLACSWGSPEGVWRRANGRMQGHGTSNC